MAVVWQICGDRRLSEKMCIHLVNFFAIRWFSCPEELLSNLSTVKNLPDVILDLGSWEGRDQHLLETLKGHRVPIFIADSHSSSSKFYSSIVGRIASQISTVSRDMAPKISQENRLMFKDLCLDLETRQLFFDSQPELSVHLPAKEAKILSLLVRGQGRPVERDYLNKKIWPATKVSPSSLNSHICRLRFRLRGSEATIESVYGGGYILK